MKHGSTSSFKTAFSYSDDDSDDSDDSVNTFQTGKTSSSQPTLEKKISNHSFKAPTSILTLPPVIKSSPTGMEPTKSIKINHIKKDKDINNSAVSISKRHKPRNTSKDYTSNQLIPNHLMNNENNSKTSFKKDENQKLSISSLSITKSHSLRKQSKAIENIIGTPIKKDHVHYILMLDMLNGIRYSVSHPELKIFIKIIYIYININI